MTLYEEVNFFAKMDFFYLSKNKLLMRSKESVSMTQIAQYAKNMKQTLSYLFWLL